MTKLDFPDTPSTGQQYGSSGTVWRWDGTRWGSTAGAAGARGVVAYAKTVASQSGITIITPITGLTATWTANPSRTYRTTFHGEVFSSVAGDVITVSFHNGTSIFGRWSGRVGAANTVEIAEASIVESGLSGTQSRSVTVQRDTGTGSVSWQAAANVPSFIMVEDITYEAGSGGPGGLAAGAGLTLSGSTLDVGGDASMTITADSIGVANNGITNAKLADMAAGTFKGALSAGDPADLNASQMRTALGLNLITVTKQTAATDASGLAGIANPRGIVPVMVIGQLAGGSNQCAITMVCPQNSTASYFVFQCFNAQTGTFMANQTLTFNVTAIFAG